MQGMRKSGFFIQRIESGTTGKGIPDIYCINPRNKAIWIELKRIYGKCPTSAKITWRIGQQSWLYAVWRRRQLSMTLVCYDDVILEVDGNVIDNPINTSKRNRFNSYKEVIEWLSKIT